MEANFGTSEGEHTDRAAVARSVTSLCSKCGKEPRLQGTTGLRTYCRECDNDVQRERRRRQKSQLIRRQKSQLMYCIDCHQPLPHRKGTGCPKRQQEYCITRGRKILNEQWPGYGDVITDEAFLVRVSKNSDLSIRLPL